MCLTCLKLNELIAGLPQVRRFLQKPGHADSYENLKVTWIPGRDPVLLIKEDGTEKVIETISLSKYSTKELNDLIISKGFLRKKNSMPLENA